MLAVFKQYLQRKTFFTPAEIEQVKAVSAVRTLRKRQYLLQAGATCGSPCLCSQQLSAHLLRRCQRPGLEHIVVAVETWWATDQENLLSGQPARHNSEAIEASTVVVLKNNEFERLRREVPAFDKVGNALVHRSFMASQSWEHSTIS